MPQESPQSESHDRYQTLFHFECTAIPLPPDTPARHRPDQITDCPDDVLLETVLVSSQT